MPHEAACPSSPSSVLLLEEGTAADRADSSCIDPQLLTTARAFLADAALRGAIKWPTVPEELRFAIAAGEVPDHSVDPAVLDRARTLLAELESSETLETSLGAAELAPEGTHSRHGLLSRPEHIDKDAILASFEHCAGKREKPTHGYEYWSADPQPWRHSDNKKAVTDDLTIANEEQLKHAAEHEDAANGKADHAEKLRCRGVRVDFLLALTFGRIGDHCNVERH